MRDLEDEKRIKEYMAAKMKHIKMYHECMNLADGLDVAKFAELVRADEREACLQAVEKAKVHQFILYPKGASVDANKVGDIYAHQHKECVKAIKARGEK